VRRPAALCAAGLALAVAGCGGGEEPVEVPAGAVPTAQAPPAAPAATPRIPEETGPELSVPREVRRQLREGATGVVDLENEASVEPRSLRANKEQVLSELRWEDWGERRTVGRGTVRTLDCQPTCGRGLVSRSPATLTLSAPRVCGSRRFYSQAKLVYRDELQRRERESRVYLRTPC